MNHGTTVTFTPQPALDGKGHPVTPDAPPAPVVIDGCAIAPGPSPELADRAREGVEIDLTVYAPGNPAIDHTFTAEISDGLHDGTYRIVADLAVWANPYTGTQPGTVIALKATRG